MLSDITIEKYILNDEMISPYDPSCLQPSSYDVHLAADYIVTKASTINAYIDALTCSYVECTKVPLVSGDGIISLAPGQFILASTKEKVKIPSNISSRFEGKSSLGRIGLMTHITAGFIDPGFEGNITLEIKNLNSVRIDLIVDMAIGQLSFNYLDKPARRLYGSKGLKSHYQNQKGVTEAREHNVQ